MKKDKIYVVYQIESSFGEVSTYNHFAVESEDVALNYCNKINRLISEYRCFIKQALENYNLYSDEDLDVWEDRLLNLREGIWYDYSEVELR